MTEPRRTRLIVSPFVGGFRIRREVDAWEGDHEWSPVYEWIPGVSDTLYPTYEAAQEALL